MHIKYIYIYTYTGGHCDFFFPGKARSEPSRLSCETSERDMLRHPKCCHFQSIYSISHLTKTKRSNSCLNSCIRRTASHCSGCSGKHLWDLPLINPLGHDLSRVRRISRLASRHLRTTRGTHEERFAPQPVLLGRLGPLREGQMCG